MRRIAALAAGLVLVAAAQAPAVAAAGSAARPLRVVAAKPPPKPSSKPSKPKPPATQSVPAPVATEPGPSQQCPASSQVSAKVDSVPWAQRALDWSSVWPMTEGRGVTVAVVDSGVDASPQLAGKVMAVDLTNTGFQDCSGDGHGTSIAGIIAASVQTRGNPFEGVAPEARILSVKVNSQETSTVALLANGIRDAALLGAQVINVSVTTPSNNRQLAAAVSLALRHGSVIVAAGGNDEGNEDCRGPCYPASYPGVLSVGAVASDGSLPSFSNQRSHVDVTAPGEGVTSTVPGGYSVNNLSGTSYATAFVSGVVALVRARYPNLSGPAIVRRIEDTANGNAGPGTGEGLVNPLQAVTAILPPAAAQSSSPTPRPQAVSVDQAPPPDLSAQRTALAIVAIALGLTLLVAIGALVIREGRRRRWRAGSIPAQADDRTRELGRPDAR